ncbi:uncharacterized protein LOC123958686, partial [Micropterus dolomieu]|uniref:uncharacterized protein LOC123958686 n=1 Tax=Micropterus dolomieu TaxID=147949 RepID=UPI001E8CE40F
MPVLVLGLVLPWVAKTAGHLISSALGLNQPSTLRVNPAEPVIHESPLVPPPVQKNFIHRFIVYTRLFPLYRVGVQTNFKDITCSNSMLLKKYRHKIMLDCLLNETQQTQQEQAGPSLLICPVVPPQVQKNFIQRFIVHTRLFPLFRVGVQTNFKDITCSNSRLLYLKNYHHSIMLDSPCNETEQTQQEQAGPSARTVVTPQVQTDFEDQNCSIPRWLYQKNGRYSTGLDCQGSETEQKKQLNQPSTPRVNPAEPVIHESPLVPPPVQKNFIHRSIVHTCLSVQGRRGLQPIPADIGRKAGYTL